MAKCLEMIPQTVRNWGRLGLLLAYPYNDKNQCLYEPPNDKAPTKSQGRTLSERRRFPSLSLEPLDEVQHAT